MTWKEERKKWQNQLANTFEIPKDIALDLPKVILVGNIQVFVENHKGILEYTPELIRIRVSIGELAIRGSNLFLRNILIHEIAIEGNIIGVELRE